MSIILVKLTLHKALQLLLQFLLPLLQLLLYYYIFYSCNNSLAQQMSNNLILKLSHEVNGFRT